MTNEKMTYSTNEQLNNMILAAVDSVKAQNPTGLAKMIKTKPTFILKASEAHEELRYRPGSKLFTYTKIGEDGMPVEETWDPDVKEDSVILTNGDLITYPEGHELVDQVVKGSYNPSGEFIIDQENGDVELRNEYVSNLEFVLGAYGVKATEEWQKRLKLDASYVLKIPEEMGEVEIILSNEKKERMQGGDYVVIDSRIKKGEVQITSVHGISKEYLDRDYDDFAEYVESL